MIDYSNICYNFFGSNKNSFDVDIISRNSFKEYLTNLNLNDLDLFIYFLKERYFDGNPIVSDSVYDSIITPIYKEINPEGSAISSVGEENFDNLEKVYHETPMLSTDKAYSKKEFTSWLFKVKKVADRLKINDVSISITPKLDGMAGRHSNNKLVTRGKRSLGFGFNVTHIYDLGVDAIGGIKDGDGEIVLSKKYFDKELSSDFSHPRNVIVGIVKSKDVTENAKKALSDNAAKFIRYSEMDNIDIPLSLAFEINENNDIYDYCYKKLISSVNFEYPIDGFVAVVNNNDIKNEMGSNTDFHYWMLAIKKHQDQRTVTVRDVVFQTGRTGRITPVVHIEPTLISGAVISKVTGHNITLLNSKGINKGAEITVVRSGEVIPYIVDVIKPSDIPLYPTCPSCGSKIEQVSESVFECVNSLSCPSQLSNSIVYHFNVLDIKNFGPSTVDKIISYFEIKNLADVYSLTYDDFKEAGFGDKTSQNLIDERCRVFNDFFEKNQIIASFGIKNLGHRAASKLLEFYSFEDIINLKISKQDISSLESMGDLTATAIYDGLHKTHEIIKRVIDMGIKYKKDDVVNNSYFTGKNILFTGVMQNMSRKEMEEKAKKNGAKIQSGVNSKTDYVIYGENAGSKKNKAEKLGIKILSEKEYNKLLESI